MTAGPDTTATTRTQRRAAASRRAVLDAARSIIAARGAEALTLEVVAEQADVAVQTIYNRVGGRAALLAAVAEEALDESRSYMDAAYEAEGTVEERLLLVAAAYAQFARERPHEFRILVEPPNESDAIDRIAALTRAQNARLAGVLREGARSGEVRGDLNPDDLATTLWAAFNGLLSLAWRPGDLRADQQTIDRLLAAHLSAVGDGIRGAVSSTEPVGARPQATSTFP
ncbi:TetR/AcrR family transcriptional regulator [Rhodococcus sp. SORGH_AS_0301]|uniref:TetR/AcrR family transcriptional regulator n=1 Tax=Rhodococcus sp. SORGH_AS_0301 TaxID=3041780 RepID=UPI002788DAD9|nr:TetR/AcrR family transcriptional regulator [Rhodococcus sp. SORGH_AS_0301]MDQ1181857.1 AcrR family transcriptional regulator [Rhodococcus sp. SORGH_AS_0301]